ncbi:peptidylprolyl isomerase [Allobaculum sp.]|uniref:peptidylprolyl isomerase n=1 Tax=Allobaculum sp. TaxID=1872463 RepID=UPI00399AB125
MTLIAIAFIGVLVYFVIDLNKDNVNSRKVDGQDVVASLNFGDITSTDLYDELSSNSSNVLYNMYRNAVVDQSVEADSEMKANAKQIAKNIENNMKSDSTGKTRQSILQTLASYGFTGDDAPYNYAMTAEKIRKLDADYLKEHFDELSMFVPESGRTISIITMQVPNADVLSDASQEKKDNIQKALDEGKDFAEVAKEYSDSDNTKDGGFYGYIDENTTDLDSNVLSAAKSLSKGGVSDWITVQPDGMEMVTLYKVYVNETDPKAMMDSGDEDVIEAIVTSLTGSVNGLEAAAVEDAASKLDITYEDDSVKEKMEKSIKEQLDAFESAKTTKKAEVESAAKESSEQSSAASSEKKTQEGE